MDEVISRQAAIDALDCINGTEEVLRSLPSAQPEGTIEELSPEEFIEEVIPITPYMTVMEWYDVLRKLREMGYVICRRPLPGLRRPEEDT